MGILEARRVLAVQPHYDDNDIGCAGTMTLLARSGAEVCYVTVTDDFAGVLDPDLPDDVARRQLFDEAREAGAIVGVTRFVDLDWPDAAGLDHVTLRDQIIDLIREWAPDLVVTVDPALPDEAHQDHRITAAAVSEAVLLSGLPRVRRETGDLARSVDRVAYYFTVQPTETVDTTSVQHERHAALDCYRAQFTADDLVGLHAAMDRYERRNAPDGATHGEVFRVVPTSALHVGLARPR
ncbi:MAG TPA: PIG-L deacetylase family protein [Ilumatobacteraceae bacterium]|nr:PIG-L deacetylase family protein [Ilumatobacteraceae bacterium]